MGLKYLTGLATSLMKYDVPLSFGSEDEFGESTIYVFTEDKKLALSCHREIGQLIFYFHDFTTEEPSYVGRIKSVKGLMREFDRFILWHHRNDRANNPFFQTNET